VSTLEAAGWVRCFQEGYQDRSTGLVALQAACDGDYLILTGREIGASTLNILAAAPRTDVFTVTEIDTPRLVNGSYWYYTPVFDFSPDTSYGAQSMGFSQDAVIQQSGCDWDGGPVPGGLCWNIFNDDAPTLASGFSLDGLNMNILGDSYYREAYMYSFDGVAKGNFTIAAGEYHTCAIAYEGEAYCWGENDNGALGDGTNDDTDADGPQVVIGGHEWASISAGHDVSCGITTSGDAYCWGENGNGELGDGTTDDSDESGPQLVIGGHEWTMVSVGEYHVCGVTTSGAAYCWGYNDDGQLGDSTYGDTLEDGPSLVAGSINWASISAGVWHTCGLSTSGVAYCWGADSAYEGAGQLGNGSEGGSSNVPNAVVGGLNFTAIDAGDFHTCGVTVSGDGYCWGEGTSGQVGNGESDDENQTPMLVAGELEWSYIDPGDDHTCGVTTSGAAYCWGNNGDGELGDGDPDNDSANTPQEVIGGYTFNQVITNGFEGGNHSCGIAMNYIAYCWGNNEYGQLGDGTTLDSDDQGPQQVLGGSIWKFLAYGDSGVDPNCGALDLSVCPTISSGTRGLIGAPGTSHVANRAIYTWLRCTVPGAAAEGPRAPATCRTIRTFKATGAQMAVRPYGVTSRDAKAGYIRLAVKVGTRTYYSGAYSVAP
jgi:alpha-tubulin suppressor-like RCC1 family protein